MRFQKEDLSFIKLNIRQKKLTDGIRVILPEGSIDSANVEEFQKKLDEALQKDISHLLLDMVDVKYLSSMGLGAIISLMHKAKGQGSKLALYDTQASVKRVLQIARLDFLELDPGSLKEDAVPFAEYISHQEPERKRLRESREVERNKRDAELARKK